MRTKEETLSIMMNAFSAKTENERILAAMNAYAKEVLVGYLINRTLMPEKEVLEEAEKYISKKIDGATNDAQIKSGMSAGIKRLRELGKHSLADDIEKKIKGLR